MATARGFLGNDYSNNQAEYFALLQCLSRALRLQDPYVIFEVDSLLLAKQLARHLPWACRSENLIALHQQCVHVCDSLPALHISWDIRHIFREFNQTADTLSNQAINKRYSNVFQHFGSVPFVHHVYVFFPSVASILSIFRTTLECQISCTCLITFVRFHSACQKKKRLRSKVASLSMCSSPEAHGTVDSLSRCFSLRLSYHVTFRGCDTFCFPEVSGLMPVLFSRSQALQTPFLAPLLNTTLNDQQSLAAHTKNKKMLNACSAKYAGSLLVYVWPLCGVKEG